MSGKIPRFSPWRPPAPTKVRGSFEDRRGSARKRGYDAIWDRMALNYRAENPFCHECARQGRDELAALVDHIIPLRPPHYGERLDRTNLQSLCQRCHAKKAELERHAETTGQLRMLSVWVKEPEKRPPHLRR